MSNRQATAAAVTAAAVAISWILYPRPVFTALAVLAVLACLAVTALAVVAAASKGRRS